MSGGIDRASPLPLWAQILEDLRRRLVKGEFESRFPTDEELTREYGVSRQTAREAVRRLAQEGLVVRQRGRGSSVTLPLLEQPLHSLYSLASTVRASGVEERSEVLCAETRRADQEIAEKLGVQTGTHVVFIERLRFAGREPIAWDRSWLHGKAAAPLVGVDLSSGGLYELLATHCAVRITGGRERVRPVVPDPMERKLLRLPSKVAAFFIERLAVEDATPIEWRQSLIRGDRYSLVAQWPNTGASRLESVSDRTELAIAST
jgi:GntR family transcriptional regulator